MDNHTLRLRRAEIADSDGERVEATRHNRAGVVDNAAGDADVGVGQCAAHSDGNRVGEDAVDGAGVACGRCQRGKPGIDAAGVDCHLVGDAVAGCGGVVDLGCHQELLRRTGGDVDRPRRGDRQDGGVAGGDQIVDGHTVDVGEAVVVDGDGEEDGAARRGVLGERDFVHAQVGAGFDVG